MSDVNDYLKLHDKVKVKIISVDEKGKIALSIKQAQAEVCGGRKPDQHTCEHSADIRRDSGTSRIDRAVMQRKEMRYSTQEEMIIPVRAANMIIRLLLRIN